MIPRFSSLNELQQHGFERIVVAMGVFDGVHIGHQQILHTLLDAAREFDAVPVVVSFSPHPREIITDWQPKLICSEYVRENLLEYYGAKAVVMIPFTPELAQLSPLEFIQNKICVQGIWARAVVVGEHWQFGHDASGNVAGLTQIGERFNFQVRSVPEVVFEGEMVSSSRIRHAITDGEFQLAEAMLNRPLLIHGNVTTGFGIATVELDTPTANVVPDTAVIPENGVYAAWVPYQGKLYNTAVAIGVAPTFEHEVPEPRVEAHLIDDEDARFDLADQSLMLFLMGKIRDEIAFEAPEELKIQIVDDIVEINEMLAEVRQTPRFDFVQAFSKQIEA